MEFREQVGGLERTLVASGPSGTRRRWRRVPIGLQRRREHERITIQPPSGLWPTCGTAWREKRRAAKRSVAAGPAMKLAKRACVLPTKPQRMRNTTSTSTA